jgi:hypothetical protein
VKSVVLSYPYPGAPINYLYDPKIQAINQPLLDQAMDGMRFQLLGGYGWHPSDSGNTIGPAPLKPHSVQALFGYSFYGYPTDGRQLQILIHSNLVSDLREFLVRYRVGTVVVFPLGSHPSAVVSRLTAVLGTPSKVDGATAWFNVGRILRVR